MKRVLFICTHNSARSQMAEAYLNILGKGEYAAESAGLEPAPINPYVIEVMREEGFDLSGKKPQSVFDRFKSGKLFHFVITVCDAAEAQCPIFPGVTHRLHVPFADPSTFTGTREEILAQTRAVRDAIKQSIQDFVDWCDKGCSAPLTGAWQHT